MARAKRSTKGNVTAAARKRYGQKGTGRFPIFDTRSATSALRLRGRAKTIRERRSIINRAAKFTPAKARAARAADRKRR